MELTREEHSSPHVAGEADFGERLSPYQGLIPYGEHDAAFFFGRETETKIIIANLFASPLTLLYGESGVGKSSVLRAGVTHQLRQQQDLLVVVFSDWQGTPLSDLKATVFKTALAQGKLIKASPKLKGLRPEPFAKSSSLAGYLAAWARKLNRRVMVILDQFEEYSLYHPQDNAFAVEFPHAILQTEAPISFLVSIREDSLAKLDRFEGSIPGLFDKYLRLAHLSPEAAKDALEKPIELFNQLRSSNEPPISIEGDLVTAVLSQVETGQVTLGQAGQGLARIASTEVHIETPYLQMVMTRLWAREMREGSRVLRLKTLQQLGGAQSIVRTHLDESMSKLSPDEQVTAAQLFRYLVTPSRSKIAYFSVDLAKLTLLPEKKIKNVLEKLSDREVRILRPVIALGESSPRYEIYHDVLAAAILDWRIRFTQLHEWAETQEKLEREQRRVTLFRAMLVGVSLIMLVLIVLALSARHTYNNALNNEKTALSRELALQANNKLQSNPLLSLLLAAEAVRFSRTGEANSALREALVRQDRLTALERQFRGHERQVYSVVFSPDGTHILTASGDWTAIIWNAQTTNIERKLLGHRAYVATAAFSPDGKSIVTASGDGTARVWDADTGKEKFQLDSQQFEQQQGKQTETTQGIAQEQEPQIRMYGASTVLVNSAAFSPDGRLIVTAHSDHFTRVWNVGTQKVEMKLQGHGDNVSSAAFSPDGKFILTSSEDKTVRLWNASTGQEVIPPMQHPYYVWNAAFSRDGTLIVTACADTMARVWETSTGQLKLILKGHEGGVNKANFSPDGQRIVTASSDNSAQVWDINTEQIIFELLVHRSNIDNLSATDVYSATFSPDGKSIATGSADTHARVWPVRERPQDFFSLAGNKFPNNAADTGIKVAFSPNRRFVVTTSKDLIARIWNVNKGHKDRELPFHKDSLLGVAYSPDGNLVVTASKDGKARIWDARTGISGHVLEGHSAAVNSVGFSPDGQSVITASDDMTARIWDVKTGREIDKIKARERLSGASFSRDGKFVVTPSWANIAWVWEVSSKKIVTELKGHENHVNTAMFSPDGKSVVTASDDSTACVWNVSTGEMHQLTSPQGRHTDRVNSAAFSHDGKLIITASDDTTARIWKIQGDDWNSQGEIESVPLSDFSNSVDSAAFSPDGQFVILVSGRANAARIYPWARFAPLSILLEEVKIGFPQLSNEECREYLREYCTR